MQTPKKRNESSTLSRRAPSITPSTSRKISLDGSELSSPHAAAKTPTSRSPKVADHKSPRSSVSKSPMAAERKRPSKVSTLESQISKLQEDLKKTKESLDASETRRAKAEQDAEEAKKQGIDAVEKLEEVQRQLHELSHSEDARVQELQSTGLERDKVWQSEVEALKEKQSADSAALSSAISEIQMLRQQLETAANSETSQAKQIEVEVQVLREELAKTVALVDALRAQLVESEKAEEEYQMLVSETQVQLEVAKAAIDTLKADGLKSTEAFNCVVTELDKSRAHVVSLEEMVREFSANQAVDDGHKSTMDTDRAVGAELNALQLEVNQLKAALDESEKRYQEEQMKHAFEIQSVNEELNVLKAESRLRESETEITLKDAKAETAELAEKLVEKDAQLLGMQSARDRLDSEKEGDQVSELQSSLEARLQNSITEVTDLKSRLTNKDAELRTILEENERLKLGMEKKITERAHSYESAVAERDLARAAEQEAMVKIGIVTEEADKNSRRAARVSEQLEAAQATNAEMEAELRRIKIQSEQWRKAAEAAAAILSNGKNGEMMERSGSYNPSYNSIGGKLLNSPFSDDQDDESPKKKSNVFKKFGGMWKKGQK